VRRRWPVAVLLVVVTATVLAGCGGSGNGSTTSTAAEAAQQWANGLCAATTTYTASLQSMGTTLKGGGLNKQTLDAVVSDAKASTQAFADSVKLLGPPPVSDSKGKQIFETLQGQLSDDADAIKSATANVTGPADLGRVRPDQAARRRRHRAAGVLGRARLRLADRLVAGDYASSRSSRGLAIM
jgi:hypothetical protein